MLITSFFNKLARGNTYISSTVDVGGAQNGMASDDELQQVTRRLMTWPFLKALFIHKRVMSL